MIMTSRPSQRTCVRPGVTAVRPSAHQPSALSDDERVLPVNREISMNNRLWLSALTLSTSLCQPLSAQAPSSAEALVLLGTAIPVSDLDRSVAFYSKGLGLTGTPRRDTPDTVEEPMVFPGGGPYLILLWAKSRSAASSPPPLT